MASAGVRQCIRDLTPHLTLLVFISTLGPVLYGFHLAELNAPQDVITCKRKTVASSATIKSPTFPPCISMNGSQFALVSSIFTLGGLLGALSAGPVSTKYGRLMTMRVLSLFFIVGSAFEALATNIPLLITGRLLSGVGAGASLVVVPIYISEIAPPNERGIFGVMTQVGINNGLLLTQILGFFLSTQAQWRIILAVGGIVAVLYLLALFLIPESPAWLATNGDSRKALSALRRIRGKGHDIAEEVSSWHVDISSSDDNEVEALLNTHDGHHSSTNKPSTKEGRSVGIIEVIRDPLYRSAIIAVVAVMVAQQFTGINSVMMYSVSLLSELFPSTSALLTIMISLVNFVMTILCAPLADVLGRKRALLLSIAGMGLSALALAFSMLYHVKVLSAISVVLFVAFFAAGLGPIPFILASELVGTEARGAAQSWALGANWIATFLVAQFFPIINEALGGRGWVYFIFAALAVVMGLFISWWVPETKGMKDADEVWGITRRDD